jgi:hypothetical protein
VNASGLAGAAAGAALSQWLVWWDAATGAPLDVVPAATRTAPVQSNSSTGWRGLGVEPDGRLWLAGAFTQPSAALGAEPAARLDALAAQVLGSQVTGAEDTVVLGIPAIADAVRPPFAGLGNASASLSVLRSAPGASPPSAGLHRELAVVDDGAVSGAAALPRRRRLAMCAADGPSADPTAYFGRDVILYFPFDSYQGSTGKLWTVERSPRYSPPDPNHLNAFDPYFERTHPSGVSFLATPNSIYGASALDWTGLSPLVNKGYLYWPVCDASMTLSSWMVCTWLQPSTPPTPYSGKVQPVVEFMSSGDGAGAPTAGFGLYLSTPAGTTTGGYLQLAYYMTSSATRVDVPASVTSAPASSRRAWGPARCRCTQS